MHSYHIDQIDQKILSFLVKNARMPFLEIAREGKAFLPVEYHDGEKASRFFYRQDAGRIYLAAFHFHPESATLTLPVARIGTLPEHALFTNSDGSMRVHGPVLEIALAGCDCVLLHCDLA